jgi:hypothetical protein
MNAGKQQLWKSNLLSVVQEEPHENYHYKTDFSFELQTIKVF